LSAAWCVPSTDLRRLIRGSCCLPRWLDINQYIFD
jgi:hypothetical protein